MMTLKLYRRDSAGKLFTSIREVHHVDSLVIGDHTLELKAYTVAQRGNVYADNDQIYVGERTPDMTAIEDWNHWDWGLLENAAGRTTEHYRPHTYG